MSDDTERWDAVAAAVLEGLERRAWGQVDLVRVSGVSAFTVRKIMQGEPGNYRPAILGKISRALWGDPNRIRRILEASGDAPDIEEGNPVVAALMADPIIAADQRDLLILAYEGAVFRATSEAGAGEVNGVENGLT